MKITKYGTVTLRQDAGPLIENWKVELEDDDPKDAEPQQLLLAYAILWAEERFKTAKKLAVVELFREHVKAKMAAQEKVN